MTACDVIVVGSGPAGCAAAMTCAQSGLDVILITDKLLQSQSTESQPEILESIHPGASSLLHKTGLDGTDEVACRSTYTGIYANGKYTPLGSDQSGEWLGMHIDRKAFDNHLLLKVNAQGITIRTRESVHDFLQKENKVIGVVTSAGEYHAKYIIDATGKKGLAGKKLNFKRKFYSPQLLCRTGISGPIEKFPFDTKAAHFISEHNAWTWLAPQTPSYCTWTRLSTDGQKSLSPPDILSAYPVVGKTKYANMRWRMYRPLCTEGILLCGDAGAMLDPAAGQGIFNALMSGIKAGSTVADCIRQPAISAFYLAQYDDWMSGGFEDKVAQLKEYYLVNDISGW